MGFRDFEYVENEPDVVYLREVLQPYLFAYSHPSCECWEEVKEGITYRTLNPYYYDRIFYKEKETE